MIETIPVKNRRNDDVVITMDGYDKSRYKWDPQQKKVVYTPVNKGGSKTTEEGQVVKNDGKSLATKLGLTNLKHEGNHVFSAMKNGKKVMITTEPADENGETIRVKEISKELKKKNPNNKIEEKAKRFKSMVDDMEESMRTWGRYTGTGHFSMQKIDKAKRMIAETINRGSINGSLTKSENEKIRGVTDKFIKINENLYKKAMQGDNKSINKLLQKAKELQDKDYGVRLFLKKG